MKFGGQPIRNVLSETFRNTNSLVMGENLMNSNGNNENYSKQAKDTNNMVNKLSDEMEQIQSTENLMEKPEANRELTSPSLEEISHSSLSDGEYEEGEIDDTLIAITDDDLDKTITAQGEKLEQFEHEDTEKTDKSNVYPPKYNEQHHETRARFLSQLFETIRRVGKTRISWSETVAAHQSYFKSDLNALEKQARLTDFACLRAYIAEKIAIKATKENSREDRVMRLRTNWRAGMTPRREANENCESSSDDDRSRSVDSCGRKKAKKPRTWQSPVHESQKSIIQTLSESLVQSTLSEAKAGTLNTPDSLKNLWKKVRPISPKSWESSDRPLWPKKDSKPSSRRSSYESRRGSTSSRSSSRESVSSDGSVLTDWAPEETIRQEQRRRQERSTRSNRTRRHDKDKRNRSSRRSSRSSSRSSSRRRNPKRHRRRSSSDSGSPRRRHSRSSSHYRPSSSRSTHSSTLKPTYSNYHNSYYSPSQRNTLPYGTYSGRQTSKI